jgi:hypothetical protein
MGVEINTIALQRPPVVVFFRALFYAPVNVDVTQEDSMPEKYEKAIERLMRAREQFFLETAMALEHATLAQAKLISTTTDAMTRGYLGVINGTTGAIMQSYAGFLDGFSRAWDRAPGKTSKKKRGRKKN